MSFFHKSRRILPFVAALLLAFVVPDVRAETREAADLRITLRVAEYQQNLFTDIDREIYRDEEVGDLFDGMFEPGDAYCTMLFGRRRWNKADGSKLIDPERYDAFRKSHPKSYLTQLVAGCWNFFTMNDIRPFLDFELARVLYPNDSYDCYSVGFMQPYIMHNILGCRSLQMLDIDWRIHAAHWQMLALYRDARFQDRNMALQAIKELRLGWIAFKQDGLRPRNPVSLASLCRRHESLCHDHLVRFQAKIRSLSDVKLDLAALHDGDYSSRKPASLKVVYLSNAVEEVYTSRDQFNLLLARVNAARQNGERALFIYHAAGTRALGFYEMRRDDSLAAGYELKTVCLDNYYRRNKEGERESYRTYFEKITVTKKPPRCQAVLKKQKLL